MQPFTFPVRIYWEDTDAGGIVFYANYLKFFERARTEWLRSRGLEQQQLRQQCDGMFVVAGTTMRYLRPARLDDVLMVSVQPVRSGRASCVIEQEARLDTPERDLLCTGTIRIGWVQASTLLPAPMPAHVLAALGQVS